MSGTPPKVSRSGLRAEPAPFRDALLICHECAAKRPEGANAKGRTRLRNDLRKRLKAAGMKKQLRVLEVSCMDLCPKHGGISLARGRDLADREPALFVLADSGDPDAEAEAVLDWLREDRPPR